MSDGCSHSVFFSVDKERTEELLKAIQRKTVTLDTLRYNPLPLCRSPPAPSTGEAHADKRRKHGCMRSRLISKQLFNKTSAYLLGDSFSAPLPCPSNGHLYPDSPSPSPPYLSKHKHLHNDAHKPPVDSTVTRLPPPLAPHHEKVEFVETQSNRKRQGLQNGAGTGAAAAQKKEPSQVQNGRNRPLERFTPEAFAQHFHQAVLQSTHSTLQNKG